MDINLWILIWGGLHITVNVYYKAPDLRYFNEICGFFV
jgi:hypothetical protein